MNPPPPRTIAGVMSGTSADGVDVAIVHVTGRGIGMSPTLAHHHARPYDPSLRQRIFAMRRAGAASLADLAQLARDVSLAYAAAVITALRAAGIAPTNLAAIAAHGQTLYHAPPNTIQWLDPALLAAEVGCPVISDFRRADCAAGGQGAPLVPFADYVLFRHPTQSRVLLNVGGIANVTCIPASASLEQVIAFDTGPGNCISDELVRRHSAAPQGFDPSGQLAARGKADRAVVDRILADAWFGQRPPKSTDGPAMIRLFDRACTNAKLADALATACVLSARAIGQLITRYSPTAPDELLVSGGGVHNQTFMNALRDEMGAVPIRLLDETHVPGAAKEALAFALLGAATLDGIPSNVPSATGAARAVVLGSITPRSPLIRPPPACGGGR
jgi:anhydro-N-acetylmuramic acid kinase